MSILFDGTTTFELPATSSGRPDGDWCNVIWVNATNTALEYIYACFNPIGSSGSWNANRLYMQGSGVYRFSLRDNAGVTADVATVIGLGGDGVDRLWVCQRNGLNFELIYCVPGGEPVVATVAIGAFGAINTAYPTAIGSTPQTTPANHFNGKLGEFFQGDFALTIDQVKYLANGGHPQYLGNDLNYYHPMRNNNDTLYDARGNYDAVGQNGATAAHFPVRDVGHGWGVPKLVSSIVVPPQWVVDESNADTINIPDTFDDTQGGTIYLETASGKVGVAWDSSGQYSVSEDGVTTHRWRLYSSGDWLPSIPAAVWPVQNTPGTTYYFATDGDDAADGLSTLTPKRTIGESRNIAVGPGDSILFKRGQVWDGASGTFDTADFRPLGGGVVGNYLKIGAWGNEADPKPIIDGENTKGNIIYLGQRADHKFIWFDNIDVRRGGFGTDLGQIRILDVNCEFIAFTDCTIRESLDRGLRMASAGSLVHHCNIIDNVESGVQFYTGNDKSADQSNVYCYNYFNNNATAAGGPQQLEGVIKEDQVFGNYFGSQNSANHSVYMLHNMYELQTHVGKKQYHHNVTDLQDLGTTNLGAPASKGSGARIFHNKIYGGSGGFVNHIARVFPSANPPSWHRNVTYSIANVIVSVDEQNVDTSYWGAIIFDRQNFHDIGGHGEIHGYLNTIVNCQHALMISSLNMENETLNAAFFHNNLVKDMLNYTYVVREAAGNQYKPGLAWSVDNNYHINGQVNMAFVAGEGARNTGVTADAMPWSEWTNGITDYQDLMTSLLYFDQNSIENGPDPQFISDGDADSSNNNYDTSITSPARSKNFPVGLSAIDCKDLPLFGIFMPFCLGINGCPAPSSPNMGAYQHIRGETIVMANGFLGKAETALVFQLKTGIDSETTMNARTAA